MKTHDLYSTLAQNVAAAELGSEVYRSGEEFLDTSLAAKALSGAPATTSRIEDLLGQTKQRAIESLYYFTTAVLSWNKLKPVPHLEMCTFIQDRENSRKVILVPRDCYKSTVASKSYPLWVVVQPEYFGLKGCEHRILIRMHSSDNAKKQVQSIRRQVERNEILRRLFPELIPDLNLPGSVWTDSALLFPREGMYGEATIECAGIDTHVVSRHYTLMIKDDLEDLASYESATVRNKVKTTYKADESLFVEEATGVDRVVGTRWGINDYYDDIFTNESDTYQKMVRPLEWTRQDLERDLEEAAKKGIPPVWGMDPDTYAPDPEKRYLFFPELFPIDACRRLRAKQGDFMYSMLYLNNPRDPSLLEFKPEFLQDCWLSQENEVCFEDRQGRTVRQPLDALHRVLMWDPALDAKKVKQGCFNAMVVMAQDRYYNRFLLDVFVEKKDPTKLIDKYIGMHQRWMVQKAGVEDAGFQRILKNPIYHRMAELEYSFPVKEQAPIGDKDFRIRGLIPGAELGRLFIRRGLHPEARTQLEGFPNYPFKDVPDAMAAACELFGSTTQAKDEHTVRRERKEEERRLASRNPVTGY